MDITPAREKRLETRVETMMDQGWAGLTLVNSCHLLKPKPHVRILKDNLTSVSGP